MSNTIIDSFINKGVYEYDISDEKGLKMTIRRGSEVGEICNITKDGLKIRVSHLET